MAQYFIQMSGVPGSGKSTVAQGIAKRLNAIILDHDDTESAVYCHQTWRMLSISLETLNHRLLNRESKPSQVKSLDAAISNRGKPPVDARELFAK